VLAAENQYTLVPWTAFLWDEDQERVVFGLDLALVRGAPSFSSLEEFPAFGIAGWDTNIAGYWVGYVDMPGETEQRPVEWDVPRPVTLALQSKVIDFDGTKLRWGKMCCITRSRSEVCLWLTGMDNICPYPGKNLIGTKSMPA
jgi:hypothetical protein